MPWYFPWSDSIKKRACRYLLQHYVGQFLQEKLTLDQLSVDLFNGKGIVKDVPLDVQTLNECLEGANVPLEIIDGFIKTISVSVPWSSLMQENCELELKGLEIVVGMKKNVEFAGSMTSESLFSSMTTSLQLAQECLKDNESSSLEQPSSQTFEGLESFAQTIESVLSRIKVSFEDVLIRFEYIPPDKKCGIGLELHLKRINYSDLSSDLPQGDQPNLDVYEPPALAHKQLCIFGLKISMDEFHGSSQTVLRNGVDQRTPSPDSVASSPPLSPYQSAVFTQSLSTDYVSSLNLLPAVVILSSSGQQEAKIRWKLNSSYPGPKIDFEYFLGTVNILVSPRQLHLLLELMSDINRILNGELYSDYHAEDLVNKPMKADDFHKIEKDLHEQLKQQKQQQDVQPKIDMWNVCFDGNAVGPASLTSGGEHETFYSLTEDHDIEPYAGALVRLDGSHNGQGLVQRVSEAGIVPLSNLADVKSGSPLSKLTMPNAGLAGISGLDDGMDNTTRGLFKMSGFSITMLLKDPDHAAIHSAEKPGTTESHDHPLCKIADRFFDQLSSVAFGSKDLDQIQETFNIACVESHLRCLLATVNVSFELSYTSSCQSLSAETSVGLMKIVECLIRDNEQSNHFVPKQHLTQLLKLSEKEEHQSLGAGRFHATTSPCLKVKCKSIQRSSSPASIQGRHSVVPKTEIEVRLGDLEIDFDLTLVERLRHIFHSSSGDCSRNPAPQYCGSVRTDINEQALFSRTMNDGSSCDQKIQIQVKCPNISASLRFPVPDLRQAELARSTNCWRKNLRQEVCLLQCTHVTFETSLQDSEHVSSYETRFRNLNGYIRLTEEDPPVPFLRVNQLHTDNDPESNGFDLPRIIVRVLPVGGPRLEEESSVDSSPDSLTDTCPILKSEPSPFSSKPVMYDKEELVVPGQPAEMKDFQDRASLSSNCHLELNFPEVNVNFHGQDFFELIYNRFGNDLLLWQPPDSPDASKPEYDVMASNITGVDLASRLTQGRLQDNFQMCHSALNNDSYSSDEDGASSEYSEQRKTLHMLQKTARSTLSLTVNCSRARLVMFPKTKNVGQDALDKLLLRFDNAQLFYVLDYKGEVNLCYTSVQASRCSLYHGLVVDSVSSDMDTVFRPGDLDRTLFESDPGVKVTGSKTHLGDNQPMLLLAVKSYLDLERNSKEFVVALSLRGATLRHRMVHEGQMWLMQMIDFFCVTDEEILGYVPPVVMTMLHVHFWSCAIHYRPLFIPYQLVITAEGFSISSNITADSKASILRFIIDDAVLLVSNSDKETMDIIKDYVAVADVDLFELTLHTVNDVEKATPKFTLTLSNNIVHIRTCSDSLAAVLELFRYFASDGDLQGNKSAGSIDAVNDDEEIFDDSPVEQRSGQDGCLPDLMSEAMAEGNSAVTDSLSNEPVREMKPSTSPKPDIFHFPGESSVMTSHGEECIALSVNGDTEIEEQDDLSDDEFCILDHPQKEQEVIYDKPKVKSFVEDIKIVPDYFSLPVGGVDQLRAPRGYPTPVYCYTVKEMSVVWHMYGGRDFSDSRDCKMAMSKNGISRDGISDTGVISSVRDELDEDPVVIDNHGNKKKRSSQPRTSLKTNGGVARDLNTLVEIQLTKVRFQYEEYPEDTKQAWRQVLLVQDVEVRDRLSSSQINKLLYQYCTEAKPRQTHANMISIKILGLRPDPNLRTQEGCLKVSLKPLRLNIDQDTLQFLISYFKDLSTPDEIDLQDSDSQTNFPASSSTPHNTSGEPQRSAAPVTSNSPPLFFRLFEFSPDVPIRLDYHGKHMDMGQRSLAGLLFAFAQLNCSEIILRRLCQRSGLMGFDRVVSYALNEWVTDIKKTQIPGILGGVGPTYSFVQLVQGVKDLFWLPVEQYRRDGRIIRGLQRGASSFTTSSAMAFLDLTNKLVQVVHGAAEVAYDVVSPDSGTVPRGQIVKRRATHEPADFRQGVANAYNVVTEGFGRTASNIVQVAKEEHENKGMTGAVGGVLRHIPSAVVQPIILATEATSNVLGGVRNQILPDARREATEKWRLEDQ